MSGASPKICLKGLVSKDSWTAKNAFFKEAKPDNYKITCIERRKIEKCYKKE